MTKSDVERLIANSEGTRKGVRVFEGRGGESESR